MRVFPLVLTMVFLAGCSTGYAIDHIRPKTFLIGPQLIRYGLSPDQAQCVGQSLSKDLSTRQLRQLSDTARAVTPGAPYQDHLSAEALLWVSSNINDREIKSAVNLASESCSLIVESKGTHFQVLPGEPLPALTDRQPPQEQVESAGKSVQNGPKDYQPSEKLWAAFDAYERRDFDAAAKLAIAASDQGDSGAHQFLGGLYAAGEGVSADRAAAVRYYALAAEMGWSEAMTNLGMAYQNGDGVARNPVEALKWYLLASHRPTEDAQLVERNRESLSATMTLDEVTEAGTLAWQWEQNRRK